MMMLVRFLVGAWALVSVALGGLGFFVATGYGQPLAAAAREGFETIPEAAAQMMGFNGAPIAVVIAYWLVLAGAIFFAFKPAGGRA